MRRSSKMSLFAALVANEEAEEAVVELEEELQAEDEASLTISSPLRLLDLWQHLLWAMDQVVEAGEVEELRQQDFHEWEDETVILL